MPKKSDDYSIGHMKHEAAGAAGGSVVSELRITLFLDAWAPKWLVGLIVLTLLVGFVNSINPFE